MSDAADALWNFAVRLYSMDGVAQACLGLQERHDADVTILIYAAWRGGVYGVATSDADAALARSRVSAWHGEIVRPLRAVRQRMKHGPHPAPDPRTHGLREQLKALELETEKVELAVLAELVGCAPATAHPLPAHELLTSLAVMLGAGPEDGLDEETRAELVRIAAAAASISAPRTPG